VTGEVKDAEQAGQLPSLTDLSVAGYASLTEVPDARRFTPSIVRRWVLHRGATDFEGMTDLSKGLRAQLASRWRVRRGTLERVVDSADGTRGLLSRLDDGQLIESVRIPEADSNTLCISSQVGCAVGCAFCASGLDGVVRNLSPGEIIEQVLVAREVDPERPLTNYVFMGSGEPTHNMKNVLAAIELMNNPKGLGIGARATRRRVHPVQFGALRARAHRRRARAAHAGPRSLRPAGHAGGRALTLRCDRASHHDRVGRAWGPDRSR